MVSDPPTPLSGPTPPLASSTVKHKAMLKLWPQTPVDQTTPKAHSHNVRNPFDDPQLNASAVGVTASHRGSNPPRTPTGSSSFYHHLLYPARAASSAASTPPGQTQIPAEPALTPGPSNGAVVPTTYISLHDPVFVMQQPPSARSQPTDKPKKSSLSTSTSSVKSAGSSNSSDSVRPTKSSVDPSTNPNSTSTSRGQLHLKLISARSLNVASHLSRPYVVVQYDNNDFVSREPIEESEKEVRGSATKPAGGPGVISRNPSTTAISALGEINLGVNRQSLRASNNSPGSSVGTSDFFTNGSPNAATSTKPSLHPSSSLFGGKSPYNPVWKHQVSFDVTNETSIISLNIYDRACDETSSASGFLGTLDIKPVLVHEHTVDEWYNLRPHENEKVTGSIRVQITYEQYKTHRSLTPRDFEFLRLIGKGTFGRVFQVRKKDTKRIYAMKVLSKREIVAKKEVAHTIGERKILQKSLNSPFLVGLKFSFQTDSDLYLVTDFKSGGELFWHLQKDTRFSEERARFYIAELILALEHLHKYDIVYRDLKPENILLDAAGHIALCDFGLSKPDLASDQLTNTFCGTTEYLAPEVLLDDHGYSKLVDFWSLGVLLFEMCCGWSPFYAEDTQQMYKNICFGKIKFPRNVINDDGKQFVKGLLNRNPKHRLGAQRDAAELKEHPFFKSIDWHALALKQVTPPFIPEVESDESVANFDPEFTGMSMADLDLIEDSDFDEEDPSNAWVEVASGTSSGFHTPNGPLGSELAMSNTNGSGAPIQIKRTRKKPLKENPLSSSVQENFIGFSFTGESVNHSVLLAAMRLPDEEYRDGDEETSSDSYIKSGGGGGQRQRMEMD